MKNAPMIRRSLTAPWAMHPDYVPSLLAGIRRAADAEDGELEQPEAVPLDDLVEGQVAVMPLEGVMLQKPGMYFAGGYVTYTEMWGEVFDGLMADDSVAAVVIDANTPGGIIYGTPELSDRIYAARGRKPILAVSNALAASAGYWVVTAADEVHVIPSGDVGSVGVYMMHMDMSKMLDDWGLKVSFIHEGEYKVEGNAFEPLSDEARAELQRSVKESYDAFIGAIARNRGIEADVVLKRFGQGRTLSAARALKAGMVDGISTLDQVIARAAELAGVPAGPALESRGRDADVEVRSLPGEVRSSDGGDWPLTGDAVPYGRLSRDMGGWKEVFEPGAFSKCLGAPDLRVVWQHDPRCVFGRVGSGTAHFWEDGQGVHYGARPPEAQWARDAMESIRRRDVDRSSIAFRVPKGMARWERRDGYDVRVVSEAVLVEGGPQTNPAYEDTSTAVRERAAWLEQRAIRADSDFERRLAAAEATV